jgi:hypothetical protein
MHRARMNHGNLKSQPKISKHPSHPQPLTAPNLRILRKREKQASKIIKVETAPCFARPGALPPLLCMVSSPGSPFADTLRRGRSQDTRGIWSGCPAPSYHNGRLRQRCRWTKVGIPFGYLLQFAGKIHPFFIGKPSINGPFSMTMLNNQRVIFWGTVHAKILDWLSACQSLPVSYSGRMIL